MFVNLKLILGFAKCFVENMKQFSYATKPLKANALDYFKCMLAISRY